MKDLIKTLIVPIVLLLLQSCLSLEGDVDMARESSITVDLTYTIDTELWNLGVFDAGTPDRTIPVTRDDAERLARRVNGTVRRYRVRTEDTVTIIHVGYRLSGYSSLEELFGGDLEVEGKHISLLLTPGIDDLDDTQREFLEEVLQDATVSLRFHLPGSVTSVAPLGTFSGKTTSFEIPVTDLITVSEPIVWVATWN